MYIEELLDVVIREKASDLHLTAGVPPIVRVNGILVKINVPPLTTEDVEKLIHQLIPNEELRERYYEKGEVDFSYAVTDFGRYRVNVFRQRGSSAAALRAVGINIPTMDQLGLPRKILEGLSDNTRGLILITGPTGSGKSTTLATMINYINERRKCHILTLEDPIEYLHKHKNSIVNQREIGLDTLNYANALRAALREDPDVILVGEMRDLETIATAITAAETGHLVLSTLHTIGAPQTIDRIIDVFPPHQQQQVKVQLSNILKGVVSQQLLPRIDISGRSVALEIMIANAAINNLIREGKTHQIYSHIQTSSATGMVTMDSSLVKLYRQGRISLETARNHSQIPDEFKRLMES